MRGKNAFTLAEVLITLGIIGVVAAMTIPTLVANYQAKSWNTSAAVFERKLEEALKVMNTQQTLAGYTTTEAFVDELKKHIKIIKTCDNTKLDNCFPKNLTHGYPETAPLDITDFTDSSKLRKEPYGTNTVGIQFANGVSAVLAYNPACRQDPFSNMVVPTSCISMIYDTSGFKSPNESGKDLRMMNVNNVFSIVIGGKKFSAPFFADYVTRAECDTIKDDYGVVKCYDGGSKDYWLGAVVTCGGMDKMPTQSDLEAIAKDLYGVSNIKDGTSATKNLTMNEEKMGKYGFSYTTNTSYSKYFYVWSGEEDLSPGWGGAFKRQFKSTETAVNGGINNNYFRDTTKAFTMCLVD